MRAGGSRRITRARECPNTRKNIFGRFARLAAELCESRELGVDALGFLRERLDIGVQVDEQAIEALNARLVDFAFNSLRTARNLANQSLELGARDAAGGLAGAELVRQRNFTVFSGVDEFYDEIQQRAPTFGRRRGRSNVA